MSTPEQSPVTWTDPELQAEDDRYSQLYASGYGEGPVAQLLEFAPQVRGCARILDAGCGRQGLARALAARGFQGQVVGVEVSTHLVQTASDVCRVEHASLDALPFADGEFDGLFCCDVLEHLSPERLGPALQELSRVLAPGGVWAISVGTEPSHCRGPEGEDLHQIVEPGAWWADQLGQTSLAQPLQTKDVPLGFLTAGLRAGAPLDVQAWFQACGWDRDPWLVLGKGPSFARHGDVREHGYRVLGLNHTVREVQVDLAHAIDLDVVLDLGPALLEQARFLAMPWHPHVEFTAGAKTLAELTLEVPVLSELARAGRLLTYDLGTWSGRHRGPDPLVPGGFFSGDVVVRLLAEAGVRKIHTLGIDGGKQYAEDFADLTPLTNGQTSFDVQALEIAKTVAAFALDYGPVPEPPQLTVLLVTWNSIDHVTDLIEALNAYTQAPFNLVVVDNGSSDGTREYLQALPRRAGFTLLLNQENLRCAGATNQGLLACQTEYVVYLCASHALVTEPGWEAALTGFLDEHPEYDLAGDVWNPGFPVESSQYAAGWTPESHGIQHLLHVQGGAWIARRRLFDEVGFFNEEEHPHGGCDVELSYRLLSHGKRLGPCPAVSCPASPRLPVREEGVAVYHPASPALRAEVRAELGLLPRQARPAAIVFCERLDNESFCAAVVRELGAHYDVRPFGPGWPVRRLEDVDLTGARFYLELDAASGNLYRPAGLERLKLPKFAWLIDTHKKPGFHAQLASEMDLTFYAMKTWGHVLPGRTAWLPVHCDQEVFKPREAERRYDLVFCGSQPWRADALRRIAKKHRLSLHVVTTTGSREKSETAALYAQAKLVFNRHVTNDLNFRVVEALACGRVLLTDAQDNGQYELFEDGRHYVLYKDEQDLERQVLHYLDEGARARIEREAAEVAQQHSTRARVAQLRGAIEAALGSDDAPREAAAPAPLALDPTQPGLPDLPAQRWLVLAGEAPASVLGTSYAEQLAEDLQQGGQQITLVQPRQRHCLPAPDREGLERVELEPSPLPTPASAGNRLLREAAALQARLERVVREQGPFDRVLAEGPLGALVGSALAKQHQLPFVLALERCEVARRGNRLTREQLHAAELEHWGAARAAEVWAPREATVAAIRRHYQPARVELRAPSRRGLRVPADPTRLLPALGLWRLPRLVLLTRPLAEEERERLFRSPAPPPPGVLLLDQAVWLTDDDGQLRCLSSRPARGPALATLLAAADALATDDACDRRVLEAQALGRQVAVWDPAPETTVQDLLARTESELLHV